MSKYIKKISMVITVVLVALVSLVACSAQITLLEGGDPTAVTKNNNSFIVTQGDYMYYTNGSVGYDAIVEADDNTYGNVVKGAIYRSKLDGTDAKVLVPQIAMDNNSKNSLNIFGEFLYFTSPSVTTSKDGDLQTTFTDFYRVDITGDNLEKITTLETDSMEYKFTNLGLYYIEGSDVFYVPYNDGIGKVKTVVEGVESSFLSTCETYNPADAVKASMNSAYTKSPEEIDGDPYNIMYALKSNGETAVLLDGKTSKTKYEIKHVESEGENTIVYYNKTITKNSVADPSALFATKFDKDLKVVTEKQMNIAAHDSATIRYNTFDDGAFVINGDDMYIPTISADGTEYDGKKISYKFNGDLTATEIFDIRVEGDSQFLYYFKTNGLYKQKMNPAGITNPSNKNDFGFIGTPTPVVKEYIKTDGVAPVLIGNNFYYINTNYLNYMYVVDISDIANKHSIIGLRTDDDIESYIKFVDEMEEDVRILHDALITEDLEDIKPFEKK